MLELANKIQYSVTQCSATVNPYHFLLRDTVGTDTCLLSFVLLYKDTDNCIVFRQCLTIHLLNTIPLKLVAIILATVVSVTMMLVTMMLVTMMSVTMMLVNMMSVALMLIAMVLVAMMSVAMVLVSMVSVAMQLVTIMSVAMVLVAVDCSVFIVGL